MRVASARRLATSAALATTVRQASRVAPPVDMGTTTAPSTPRRAASAGQDSTLRAWASRSAPSAWLANTRLPYLATTRNAGSAPLVSTLPPRARVGAPCAPSAATSTPRAAVTFRTALHATPGTMGHLRALPCARPATQATPRRLGPRSAPSARPVRTQPPWVAASAHPARPGNTPPLEPRSVPLAALTSSPRVACASAGPQEAQPGPCWGVCWRLSAHFSWRKSEAGLCSTGRRQLTAQGGSPAGDFGKPRYLDLGPPMTKP